MSKHELHRYRFSQRVGIEATLWTCIRGVFDSSETAPFAVLTGFSRFSSVSLRTNAGRLCRVMCRVLLNCNSVFTSRTIQRCIMSDADGVVKWPAKTEMWRIDPLLSENCRQRSLLGNARNNRRTVFSVWSVLKCYKGQFCMGV